MATTEQLRTLMDERRNGCNRYFRHLKSRDFHYTDGIKEVLDLCDAYWLLDMIGTEAAPALRADYANTYASIGFIELDVSEGSAYIRLTTDDDHPAVWKRQIEHTDFPAGGWVFKLGLNSVLVPGATVCVMCLLSEDY